MKTIVENPGILDRSRKRESIGSIKKGAGTLKREGKFSNRGAFLFLLTVRKPRGRKQRKTKESKEVVFFLGEGGEREC